MATYIGTKKLTSSQEKAFKSAISKGKSGSEAIKEATQAKEQTETKEKVSASKLGLSGEDIAKLTISGKLSDKIIEEAAVKKQTEKLVSIGVEQKAAEQIASGKIVSSSGVSVVQSQKGTELATEKAGAILTDLRTQESIEAQQKKQIKELQKQGFESKLATEIVKGTVKTSDSFYKVGTETTAGFKSAQALAIAKAQEKQTKVKELEIIPEQKFIDFPSLSLRRKAEELEIKQIRATGKGEFAKGIGFGLLSAGTTTASEFVGFGEQVYEFAKMQGLPIGEKALKQKEIAEGVPIALKEFQISGATGKPQFLGTLSTIVLTEGIARGLSTKGAFKPATGVKAAATEDLLVTTKNQRTAKFLAAEETATEINIPKTQKTLTDKFKITKIEEFGTNVKKPLFGQPKTENVKIIKLDKTLQDLVVTRKEKSGLNVLSEAIEIEAKQKALSSIKGATEKDLIKLGPGRYGVKLGTPEGSPSFKSTNIKQPKTISFDKTLAELAEGKKTTDFEKSLFKSKKGTAKLVSPSEIFKETTEITKNLNKATSRITGSPATAAAFRFGSGAGVLGAIGVASAVSRQPFRDLRQSSGLKVGDITKVGISEKGLDITKTNVGISTTPATQITPIQSVSPLLKTTAATALGISTVAVASQFKPFDNGQTKPQKPTFPDMDINIGSGGGYRDFFGRRKARGQKSKYTASLVAQTFNIRGKLPKGKLTGLEFRPLRK